jgi:hypothetical protein
VQLYACAGTTLCSHALVYAPLYNRILLCPWACTIVQPHTLVPLYMHNCTHLCSRALVLLCLHHCAIAYPCSVVPLCACACTITHNYAMMLSCSRAFVHALTHTFMQLYACAVVLLRIHALVQRSQERQGSEEIPAVPAYMMVMPSRT